MRRLLVAPAVLLLTLTGCSDDGDDGDRTLTVLAASSLTGIFEELADEFEEEHDGVEVTFSFGSSTTLAEQAVDGAPGDVLATADETSIQVAADGDALEGEPVAFATNTMVLVAPAGNPAGISSLDDLAGSDWVRCADDVPCGRIALGLLDANSVDSEPASLEVDVKSVLAKVTSGEADAGFVYATDAIAAGDDVEVVQIPGAGDQLTTYFVAALAQSGDAELAADWVALLESAEGREELTEAGFTLP